MSDVAESYLKAVQLEETPKAKELVDAFVQSGDLAAEVEWQKLGKDISRLYVAMKQYVKKKGLPVIVRKQGQKLLLLRAEGGERSGGS